MHFVWGVGRGAVGSLALRACAGMVVGLSFKEGFAFCLGCWERGGWVAGPAGVRWDGGGAKFWEGFVFICVLGLFGEWY